MPQLRGNEPILGLNFRKIRKPLTKYLVSDSWKKLEWCCDDPTQYKSVPNYNLKECFHQTTHPQEKIVVDLLIQWRREIRHILVILCTHSKSSTIKLLIWWRSTRKTTWIEMENIVIDMLNCWKTLSLTCSSNGGGWEDILFPYCVLLGNWYYWIVHLKKWLKRQPI
jgi:hypothetical protein